MDNKNVYVPKPDGSVVKRVSKAPAPKGKMSSLLTLLNIAIGVLAAVLVIEGFVIVAKTREINRVYYNEPRSLSGLLKRSDFGMLVNFVGTDRARGVDESKQTEYAPFYAVADYYKAASLYKVYAAKGYDDRAARELDKMEKTKSDMGDLDMFVEDINQTLGIDW